MERRTYRCLRIHSNSTLFFPRMTFSQPQQGTTKLEVWLLKIHLSYDLEIMACTDNTFSTLKTGGTKNKYHHHSSEHSYCVNTFIRHTFSKQLTATSNSSDLQVYNSKRFHKVLCFFRGGLGEVFKYYCRIQTPKRGPDCIQLATNIRIKC